MAVLSNRYQYGMDHIVYRSKRMHEGRKEGTNEHRYAQARPTTNETKRNETERNETKRNETKRNQRWYFSFSFCRMIDQIKFSSASTHSTHFSERTNSFTNREACIALHGLAWDGMEWKGTVEWQMLPIQCCSVGLKTRYS